MSVSRRTAEDFRARVNRGLPAKLLRDQPGAVCGSIWTLAAEALEQLAKPPDPARTWARSKLVERLKARVAELEFALRDIERERDKPPPATVTDVVWRQAAIMRAEQIRTLEAIVSRALDHAHDEWGDEVATGFGPLAALAQALHEAGLFDADEGTIKPAGHALQLRAATTAPEPAPAAIATSSPTTSSDAMRDACMEWAAMPASARERVCAFIGWEHPASKVLQAAALHPAPAPSPPFSQTTAEAWEEATRARIGYYPGHEPDCAERQTPHGLARCGCGPKPPRPLRVYVAGGSSEVELVARYIAALRAAGVEITYDWTADVLLWRAAGSPQLTAEQRAAHARADLDGIERADLMWWILPSAKSEGAALEVGVAIGSGKRIMVSGSVAFDPGDGRAVFPSMIPERWDSHEAALAAIVSLAAAHRDGDQSPTS